jgi:pimeloyl-ACP methyl ester carboxylesterase
MWHDTRLAAVGAALLRRPARERTVARWAVPRSIDQSQLRRLVEQLARSDRGQRELAELWRCRLLKHEQLPALGAETLIYDLPAMSTSPHVRSMRRLRDPYPQRWVLLLSDRVPTRLIVFVHGFRGGAVSSWQRFPLSTQNGWWRSSDLLFVGYDSTRDNITGVAKRLCRQLPRFYPQLPDDLLVVGGDRVRAAATEPYRELVLVGHSLGGVVLRRALSDTAQSWLDACSLLPAPRPPLLDARLRLFSPASAGFRPAGLLGLMQASSVWHVVNLVLRHASAYTDLQPGSQILTETRKRTERLVTERPEDLEALRASILWANPDDVVVAERYDSDRVDDAVDGRSHRSVCKPSDSYREPWLFVETGSC